MGGSRGCLVEVTAAAVALISQLLLGDVVLVNAPAAISVTTVAVALGFGLGYLLSHLIRARVLSRGIVDVPNARSSHTVPTPRGGGLAVVAVVDVFLLVCASLGALSRSGFALLAAVAAIAFVGWIDDMRGLSARIRLCAQVAIAGLFVAMVFPTFEASQFSEMGLPEPLVAVGFVVALVWGTNLFNFMDGIDGLAGSQATFMCVMGSVLLFARGQNGDGMLMLVAASSCVGFLMLNWPPAKIFMGDVGSTALGFLLVAAPLATSGSSPAHLLPWVALWSVFASDATITLIWRVARGANPSEAHRDHAYQRLSRRWESHLSVTTAAACLNWLWVGPCALLAEFLPAWSLMAVAMAFLPAVSVVVWSAWRHSVPGSFEK